MHDRGHEYARHEPIDAATTSLPMPIPCLSIPHGIPSLHPALSLPLADVYSDTIVRVSYLDVSLQQLWLRALQHSIQEWKDRYGEMATSTRVRVRTGDDTPDVYMHISHAQRVASHAVTDARLACALGVVVPLQSPSPTRTRGDRRLVCCPAISIRPVHEYVHEHEQHSHRCSSTRILVVPSACP